MLTIRKATTADCELIHKLAWQIFPETYKDILSPEQNDYMMEWMYSIENIRKQMEEEGHVYFIGYKDKEVCGAQTFDVVTVDYILHRFRIFVYRHDVMAFLDEALKNIKLLQRLPNW